MAGRDPTRIAETLRGVAGGTMVFRISPGQTRTISAGILSAAADVADELASVTAERDRAMAACAQIGAQIAARDAEIARLREGIRAAVERRYERAPWDAGPREGVRFCAVYGQVKGCPHCLDAHLLALLDTPAPEDRT